MRIKPKQALIPVLLLAAAFASDASGNIPVSARAYTSGFVNVLKLGDELEQALPPKFATQLDAQPIVLQPQDALVVVPVTSSVDNRVERQVCLSAGFIEFVNRICHAKAIDHVEPGFFARYIANIQQVDGSRIVAPEIIDARYWTDDILNDQVSYFNQTIGFTMALTLAHQYLGQCTKYAARISAGPGTASVPINTLLSQQEWDASFRAGALNALNCALATDGPRALLEVLSKMSKRPRWADYLFPPAADPMKLGHQLERWETQFFQGRFQ